MSQQFNELNDKVIILESSEESGKNRVKELVTKILKEQGQPSGHLVHFSEGNPEAY